MRYDERRRRHVTPRSPGRLLPDARLYRSLGVQEYWQYDPKSDYLKPPLQGLALIGKYRGLAARELADGRLALANTLLGMALRAHCGLIGLIEGC